MTRKTAELLGSQTFGGQLSHYATDPTYGGQGGWANDLSQWLNNQAYVSKQLIAIVLEAPGFFSQMENPQKWHEILRAFFETHVRTIEGLHSGISLTFDEHPVGGAGEVQHEPTDSKRAPSEPTITVVDKVGLPFQNWLRCWIQYGIMDPDTKFALATNLENTPNQAWTAEQYTATVLFFEPDPSHRRVTKSWLCTNMMPHTNGDEDGRRDMTAAGELLTLSIPFTCITQTGVGVKQLAQSLLDELNKTNANPYLRPAFVEGIDSDVAAATTSSYATSMATVADTAIRESISPAT